MATHSMENPMDRGALRATVHGVTKSQTQLSNYTHIHTRPSSIPTSSMKPSRTLLPDSGCTCNLTCWLTPPLLCIKFWISSKAGPLLWLYTLSLGGSIHITSLPWSRCCSSFIFISNSILVIFKSFWLCHWTILTDQHGTQDLSFPKEFYPPWASPR